MFMVFGYIVMVFPAVALASLILYLPFYFAQKRRSGGRPLIRHIVVIAFIGCCLSLIYLTLLWYYPDITFHPYSYSMNLRPFGWMHEGYAMGGRRTIEQLVLNVVMFVPYGLLLPMVFRRLRKLCVAALIVAATTLAIETIQYFMGRSADIDDIIMNLIGGILGYLLFALLRRVCREKRWWMRAVE